ncbi:MAG TPA: TlpA disulfide reductase family protein [Sediminibacterium sp.]|nr:TlpA disulfide reductase family protein [Sediminibacterium sp.]
MNFKLLTLLCISLTIAYASKSQDPLEQVRSDMHLKATGAMRDSLDRAFQLFLAKFQAAEDTLEKRYYQSKLDSLDKVADRYNLEGLLVDLEFVKKHLSSPISVTTLLFRLKKYEGQNYYKEIYTLYNALNPALKKTQKGIELREALADFKNSSIGKIAPDFQGKDINGKELSLKAFQNKNYVLLDFWASWCAPCRQDFPSLKELYQKYHPKGLEMINISRDEDLDMWRDAIKKDGVEIWKHFSVKQNNSPIEKLYFVTAIPVKVLINKQGVIIGRWRGGGEEHMAAVNKMLQQLFME